MNVNISGTKSKNSGTKQKSADSFRTAQQEDFMSVLNSNRSIANLALLNNNKPDCKNHKESVDAVYSLDEINDALNKVANGKSKGKTIIRIG